MIAFMHRFLEHCTIDGMTGWGSGGPDGWYREWLDWVRVKQETKYPIGTIARRTAKSFARMGYVDAPDLCPWGGAEEYTKWADRYKSQFKTSLCDNQHLANIELLIQHAKVADLPKEELLDHLHDPDPKWLKSISILLMVGEQDRNHWGYGGSIEEKLEYFFAKKYHQRTQRTKLLVVPRYGHFGFVGAHNEKIGYLWCHAIRSGFFD